MSVVRDTSGFISDRETRTARAKEKELTILNFLKAEVYSHVSVLSLLLGVGRDATERTLKRLVGQGFVKKSSVGGEDEFTKKVILWGITLDGYDQVADFDDMDSYKPVNFQPSKISPVQLPHTLNCQYCHVWALKKGKQWIPTRALPGHKETIKSGKRWAAYPDGVVLTGNNGIAIEVELSKKTPSRYEKIIKNHLQNIKEGRYSQVLYLRPTKQATAFLEKTFIDVSQKAGKGRGLAFFTGADEIGFSEYEGAQIIEQFFRFRSLDFIINQIES